MVLQETVLTVKHVALLLLNSSPQVLRLGCGAPVHDPAQGSRCEAATHLPQHLSL